MGLEKETFLRTEFPALCRKLKADQKGKWGLMNAQQMVEHMSESIRIANGKFPHKVVLTPEQVQKAHSFMVTEKPFRENTKNQLLPEQPAPLLHPDMVTAINELESEIRDFFLHFDGKPGFRVTNPFFGELNREEWIHLLHKHATHHLRQFGLL